MALSAKYAEATASWQMEGSLIIGIKKVLEVSYKTLIAVFFSVIEVDLNFNDIIKAVIEWIVLKWFNIFNMML